jgi:hypothetical protein
MIGQCLSTNLYVAPEQGREAVGEPCRDAPLRSATGGEILVGGQVCRPAQEIIKIVLDTPSECRPSCMAALQARLET